eukprot:PITA_15541
MFLKLQPLDSREAVSLFNVYVPSNIGEKRECWDSIRQLSESENLQNIIVAGDLNLTMCMGEKRGGTIIRDPAREWVEDLMQDWDLLDIPPENGKYTWSNKRIGLVKEPEFLKLVQDCWILPVKGSPFFIWEEKLRRLKAVLKTWAKSLPSPAKERKQAQDNLAHHHAQSEDAKITKEVLDKEAELQQIFHKACLSEEEHWR